MKKYNWSNINHEEELCEKYLPKEALMKVKCDKGYNDVDIRTILNSAIYCYRENIDAMLKFLSSDKRFSFALEIKNNKKCIYVWYHGYVTKIINIESLYQYFNGFLNKYYEYDDGVEKSTPNPNSSQTNELSDDEYEPKGSCDKTDDLIKVHDMILTNPDIYQSILTEPAYLSYRLINYFYNQGDETNYDNETIKLLKEYTKENPETARHIIISNYDAISQKEYYGFDSNMIEIHELVNIMNGVLNIEDDYFLDEYELIGELEIEDLAKYMKATRDININDYDHIDNDDIYRFVVNPLNVYDDNVSDDLLALKMIAINMINEDRCNQ